MKCPVCDVDLAMGERLSTSIDYCPKCRGIWLEKGKLDQISQRAAAAASPTMQRSSAPPPTYTKVHDDHDDHDHYKKKKKGLFEQIFD